MARLPSGAVGAMAAVAEVDFAAAVAEVDFVEAVAEVDFVEAVAGVDFAEEDTAVAGFAGRAPCPPTVAALTVVRQPRLEAWAAVLTATDIQGRPMVLGVPMAVRRVAQIRLD